MKKRIIFMLTLVVMVCIFALSVGATEFGELETVEGMNAKSNLDTTSRVVLFDGTNYHTYPAYYIFKNDAKSGLDFTQLNKLTGVTYSVKSVVMVEFPEGITSAGSFNGATLLEYAKLPNTATEVRGTAFKECANLTTVVFPKEGKITTFADQVFVNCTSLVEIELPEGLASVGTNLFNGCTALKTVTLPDSLTHIGENMFKGCISIASISIPENVTSIDRNGFNGCNALTSITIPSKVTSIGNAAFQNCTALTTVNFPAGLTSIGESAFDTCTALEIDVVLPSGVTVIPKRAFFQSGITSVSIPANTTIIGYQSFCKCPNLNVDIVIPEGVTEIAYKAFSESPIKSVVVPSTVTTMGNEVFLSCKSLKTADVKCETISSNAFDSCTALETVTLSNTKVIGGRAFTKCTKLSSVNLPEGLTTINTCAFYLNTALKSVTVPSTVTVIEEKAFEDSGVTTAVVKSTVVGDRMFYRAPLTSITLENTVTIGSNAFYQCDFTEIVLPETVTSVASGAFGSCSSLENVTIPANVETLDSGAFSNCKALTKVNYTGTNTELISGAVSSDIIVTVSHCDTYNGGNHASNGKGVIKEKDFFKDIVVSEYCSVCGEKCSDVETIKPIFIYKGYSKCEFSDGNGITQGLYINRTAMSQYKKYVSDFDFGILVTLNKNGTAYSPLPSDENVIDIKFDTSANDYIDLKLTGITDTKAVFVFCAYVTEGEKLYYLEGGTTSETVIGVSYETVQNIN